MRATKKAGIKPQAIGNPRERLPDKIVPLIHWIRGEKVVLNLDFAGPTE